jgi:putative endonuclease
MAESHHTGKKGEEIAKAFLEEHHYEILQTNWQSNHQEVDIIARKNNLLIIAEVKTRRSASHGAPETFVNRQKQKMLIKAANHYMAMHHLDSEVRFDIISILFKGNDIELKHIKDAFYPTIFS